LISLSAVALAEEGGKIKRFCFKVKSNGTLINAEKSDLTKGARF
jgi:hypothetical protein